VYTVDVYIIDEDKTVIMSHAVEAISSSIFDGDKNLRRSEKLFVFNSLRRHRRSVLSLPYC